MINGPNVVLVGGVTAPNTVLTSSVRANTAPLSPFFQLGLVGATVPGMKIEGEIGQQLGYLNAAGVGTVDFIILILIGWAFAHKAQTRAMIGRVLHRGGAASPRGAAPARRRHAPRRAPGQPAGSSPFARRERAAPDRQPGPFPGIHPAGDVDDIGPTGPDQVAGHRRRPAADVADDQQRPVGRQLADPGHERRCRDEDRVRRANLGELVRLADVEQQRPIGILAKAAFGLGHVDRRDRGGWLTGGSFEDG